MGLLDTLYKYGEPALNMLSGAAAEPVAGWAGLLGGGADAVQNTRNALTYQPRTPQGQQGQSALYQALMGAKQTMVDNNPPVNAMVNGYNSLTDKAGAYSPALGAAMKTLPAAASMFLGPGGSQVRGAFGNVAREGAANAMAGPAMHGPMSLQDGAIQWHGSPHTFDKFDAGKIGTGEGAQAYGHGLYLADSPDVAQSYLRSNSAYGLVSGVDGSPVDLSRLPPAAKKFLHEQSTYGTSPEEMIRTAQSTAAQAMKWDAQDIKNGIQPTRQPYIDAMNHVERIIAEKQIVPSPGSLYKVDLPDEHIAKMLDWDKPLSQQPQVIPNITPDWKGGNAKTTPWAGDDSITGQQLWNTAKQVNGSAVGASNWLRDMGIPGIRYLDGNSRGVGGTQNTVLFPGNEHLLQILERNGMPIGGQ